MKNKLSEFFMDGDRMLSATRLAFLLWSIGLFFIWAIVSYVTKTLVEIPQSVVEITLCFMLGKMGGAWIENVSNNQTKKMIFNVNDNKQDNLNSGFQTAPPQ